MFFFTVGFYFPIFYIELDATLHGIDKNFAFYSVSHCFVSYFFPNKHRGYLQLVLLNGCGFIGRVGSGLLASKLGVINLIVAACYGCSALIFAMIGLRTVGSVVVIAILYGLLTGACESFYTFLSKPLTSCESSDFNLPWLLY